MLVYAGDVLGLGHLRRNVAIASRVIALVPGTDVLILTNLPSVGMLDVPPGIDIVKLPSVARRDAGRYDARALGIGGDAVLDLRAGVIETLVARFAPQLVVVDHLPTGVCGELLPALEAARSGPAPPRAVLGLRDILDDPDVTRARWSRGRVYDAIDRLYDEILVYGSREIFDTAAAYGLDAGLATPLTYCGHVGTPPVATPGDGSADDEDRGAAGRAGSRAPGRHGGPRTSDRPRVLVTAGGGADGYPILAPVIDALCTMPASLVSGARVVTGPFMGHAEREALRQRAAERGIDVRRFDERLPERIAAADLVVTMAGYNTLGEIARSGRRSLVIPRPGPSAEQRLRAALFERLGLVTRVAPATSSPAELAAAIESALDAPRPAARFPQADGLERAARRLAATLRENLEPALAGAGAEA